MTNELGAEARALIDQALNEESAPRPAELERIRKNVVAGVALTAVLFVAPHAAGFAGTAPAALFALALKGAAAGTLVVLAAFSFERVVVNRSPASVDTVPPNERLVTAPARSSLAGTARPSETAGITAPAVPASRESARSPLSASSADTPRAGAETRVESSPKVAPGSAVGSMETSSDLYEEAALLRRVQQELRAGRGAEALRLLDASSPRLERGQLRQERLVAEVLAACKVGDFERARRSARTFAAENPATPSMARLRSSCVGSESFDK